MFVLVEKSQLNTKQGQSPDQIFTDFGLSIFQSKNRKGGQLVLYLCAQLPLDIIEFDAI